MKAIKKLEKIANGESLEFTNDDFKDLTNNFAEIALSRYNSKMEFLSSNPNLSSLSGVGDKNYNPLLAQGKLNDYHESLIPTQKKLSTWLANPNSYSSQLRKTSEYFYNASMQYRRVLSHLGEILLYNYTLNPIRKPLDDSEEELEKFMDMYYKGLEYLPKLNVKYNFPKMTIDALKSGVGYYYYVESEDFVSFLKLPSDYCYITGTWDWGYTFALDLSYFDDYGTRLKEACPELAKAYRKFITIREAQRGSLDEETLTKSRYYMVGPLEGLALLGDDINSSINPVAQGVFKDVLEIDEYKRLTKSKTILDTFKLIVQEIPFDKTGEPYVSVGAARKAVAEIKKILPDNVGVIGTPLSNSKAIDFTDGAQNRDNIVGLGEQQFWRNVGTSGMIMDTAQNTSKIVEYGLVNDHAFVEKVQRQLENFVNIQLMQMAKEDNSPYIQKVKFFGNRYTNDTDTKNYLNLVQSANMPVSKLFAYAGYEPFEVEPSVILENKIGLKEKLSAIIPGAQQSNEQGRPEMEDSEITDAAEDTRERDSGEERRM